MNSETPVPVVFMDGPAVGEEATIPLALTNGYRVPVLRDPLWYDFRENEPARVVSTEVATYQARGGEIEHAMLLNHPIRMWLI